jgi:hypothetical protein
MRRLLAITLVVACNVPVGAFAQTFAAVQTTSHASQFMRSVRGAGMAGSGVADPAAAASVAANPANAVGGAGPSVFFQHDEFRRDFSTSDYGARYGGNLDGDRWLWGVTLRHQRWGYDGPDIEERTVFLPEGTGNTLDLDETYTVASVAGAIRRGGVLLALGFSARYESIGFVSSDRTGWTYGSGARAEWRLAVSNGSEVTLRGGAAVMDLDNTLDGDSYDVTYRNLWRVGGGVSVHGGGLLDLPLSGRPVRAASIAVDLESADQDGIRGDSHWALGLELGLAETLYLRGGTTTAMPGFSDGTTWGLGLATGAGALRICADVARYRLVSILGREDNTIFGFSVSYRPAGS